MQKNNIIMIKYLFTSFLILFFSYNVTAQDYSVVRNDNGKYGLLDNASQEMIIPCKL